MEKEKDNQRIIWLDFAKGIGIILVLLGHSFRDEMITSFIALSYIKHFIYLFHMPFFFFLSGASLIVINRNLDEKIWPYILNRFKRLVVPALIYSFLIYLFFLCAWYTPARKYLQNSAYNMVSIGEYIKLTLLKENPYCVHVWYAIALFVIDSFVFLVLKISKGITNQVLRALELIVIQIVFLFIILKWQQPTYMVHKILTYTVYYFLGFLIIDFIVKKSVWISCSIIPGTIMCIWYVRNEIFVYNALYYALCVPLMISGLTALCVLICRKTEFRLIERFFGKNSFTIYLLHQPICGFVGVMLIHFIAGGIFVSILEMGISIIAGLLFTIVISWLLNLSSIGKKVAVFLSIRNLSEDLFSR